MSAHKPRLLLFMRHGHHATGELTFNGRARIRSTAGWTADTLIEMGRHLDGVTVGYVETPGGTPEAQHSAATVQKVLAERFAKAAEGAAVTPGSSAGGELAAVDGAPSHEDLVPAVVKLETSGVNAYEEPHIARKAVRQLRKELENRREPIMLVVGNDPFLGWVIHHFGCRVALGRGELAALQRRTHAPRWWRSRWWPSPWSVCWAIMEGEGTALDSVRDKIRSKMDVAKVFGALGVALLTFLLQERVKGTAGLQTPEASLALLAIGAGTALYFATLFAYDLLLMPTRFWMPRRRRRRARWVSERPPSSDFWILYQNMIHAWSWLFVPASLLVAVGLVLLGLAPEASRVDWWWAWLAGSALVVAGWWWRHRPRLGATD
jgi:hypothetical protein